MYISLCMRLFICVQCVYVCICILPCMFSIYLSSCIFVSTHVVTFKNVFMYRYIYPVQDYHNIRVEQGGDQYKQRGIETNRMEFKSTSAFLSSSFPPLSLPSSGPATSTYTLDHVINSTITPCQTSCTENSVYDYSYILYTYSL